MLEIDPERRIIEVTRLHNWAILSRQSTDLSTMQGTAELTVQPLDQNLKMIRINSRQCRRFLQHFALNCLLIQSKDIRQASVNNIPAKYAYTDAISELSLGSDADVTHHQSYKSKYLTAMRETDDGELAIELPENVVKPVCGCRSQRIRPKLTTFRLDLGAGGTGSSKRIVHR